jgi:hypothetical protein
VISGARRFFVDKDRRAAQKIHPTFVWSAARATVFSFLEASMFLLALFGLLLVSAASIARGRNPSRRRAVNRA